MNTFQRLKEIILAQGIIDASAIHLNADLFQNLAYNHNNIAELARMIGHAFKVQIDVDTYSKFATLSDIVYFLNEKQIEHDLTQPFSDH